MEPPAPTGVLDRAGSEIRYWLTGPESGPLVVCSHGASMDHRMFDPQLPALHDAGYRVLTWDMRGHGQSKPIGELPLTTHGLANDLTALLDRVGATEPVCLLGQSLGGNVSQELVYARPHRVAALVIVGSTCSTAPLTRAERLLLASSPWWFRPWPYANLRKVVARATALRPEVQAYAHEACGTLSKKEFLAVWKAATGAVHDPPPDDYRIEAPLLLTHGESDGTGNIRRTAPTWAAREPACTYKVIPEAGHNANQDNPDVFNPVLTRFLATHYAVRS